MDNIKLKKTPLYDLHVKLGARLIDFAGWSLPVQFNGIIAEHIHTRTQVGLFDVSHMGEIEVNGPQAYLFLQQLLTNDLSRLEPGRSQYTMICNEQGGVVDDCIVFQFTPERYWIVTNAANTEKDLTWLKAHSLGYKVRINNISDIIAKLDIQGPLAAAVLSLLAGSPPRELKRFGFCETSFRGQHQKVPVVISRTGYTGEDGFEIFMPWDLAPEVWQTLLATSNLVKPVGLGARDTLRLEACYPLYGHELDEQTSPAEAGLGWVIRDKSENYPGKDILIKQKQEGTPRQLYAFIMQERLVPRPGYPLYYQGEALGQVTSGCFSPTLNKSLGLGYINRPGLQKEEKIQLGIREKLYEATIVDKPFYIYRGVIFHGQRIPG